MKSNINFLGSVNFSGEYVKKYQFLDNLKIVNDSFEVCDSLTIDKYFIHIIQETILDGSENWLYDDDLKAYYCILPDKFSDYIGGRYDCMLCNYFAWSNRTDVLNLHRFCGGDDKQIYFNYDNGVGGVDNFVNWLCDINSKGKPLIVHYIRNNPIIVSQKSYNCNPRFIPSHFSIVSNIQPNIRVQESIISSNKFI